jgi:hypothetical protein
MSKRKSPEALGDTELFRELDCRSSAGITVTLFWEVNTTNTLVEVIDQEYHTYDVLDVYDPVMAPEVFNHPFAYIKALGRAIHGKSSR